MLNPHVTALRLLCAASSSQPTRRGSNPEEHADFWMEVNEHTTCEQLELQLAQKTQNGLRGSSLACSPAGIAGCGRRHQLGILARQHGPRRSAIVQKCCRSSVGRETHAETCRRRTARVTGLMGTLEQRVPRDYAAETPCLPSLRAQETEAAAVAEDESESRRPKCDDEGSEERGP